MKRFLAKLDPRQYSRRQLVTAAAGVVAVYLIVAAVNVAVLYGQTKSTTAQIPRLRRTVNDMLPGLHLADQILDADLKNHQAVARVGEFYLAQARFDQLGQSRKTALLSIHYNFNQQVAVVVAEQDVNRLLEEQLVGQFAAQHNITASPQEIQDRITPNIKRYGGLTKLEKVLRDQYNWTISDLRDEVEYSILRAKMEEALGGQTYAELSKGSLQNAVTPKVSQYATDYARTHTNYVVSGGYLTLAKRLLNL